MFHFIIIESFYSLWSTGHSWRASKRCDLQLSPRPHSMIFLCFLFHPLLSFATFSSAYLFFYTPEDSNLMRFSLLLLLLYVMCVQSNSIFSLLSEYGTHIPSGPFTPCGAQGIHVELPSVVISSCPLDLIPWSSCVSYFILYCPSPCSLQPTSSSIPLSVPI
jgi:hypothetical protein